MSVVDADFSAVDSLLDELVEVTPITYSRGASSVAIERAIWGSAKLQAERDGIVVVESDYRPCVFQLIDLILNGSATVPQRGDRITDDKERLFEVLPVTGEQVYEFCDVGWTRVRVHTKRISIGGS
jgi:hypothetical protein